MTLPVPNGNDIFNHAQAWKTEHNIILIIKKDLPFISARGNTFFCCNVQKYGCLHVHCIEENISLIFFNELAPLSLFPVPDLC